MKRQLRRAAEAALIAAMLAAAGSCSGKSSGQLAAAEYESEGAVMDMAAPRLSAKMTAAAAPAGAAYEEGLFRDAGSGGAAGTPSQNAPYERKLIKTGNLSLEVQNLAEAGRAVERWCGAFGGYVASSDSSERNASFSARIPAERFDSAMEEAGTLGTVRFRSVSAQDVSEQFYDLQTRLETRKIMRDRLRAYLAQAKDVKDMLQIERELNSVLSDIESMEGRMRRLSGQIEYATIDISLSLPYRATDRGFVWPDFGNGCRRFVSNIIDFFGGFFRALLYIAICGIPIVAAAAFFWWLLLGRLGLLKRLFKAVSGRKS
ncbi:MAG: DUF4349 domain-containing protein [Treponemataceae bacterium]|nr:DUF4349 domain-containing protein [Treponemataceae bacterium]